MKSRSLSLLALAFICLSACVLAGCPATPQAQSGIVGRWRNADGSFTVEFLPSGDCSARMRIQSREVGGPCKYTVEQDTITLHYSGINAANGPNETATWHYTLQGDSLNVSVFGNSMALQRVH